MPRQYIIYDRDIIEKREWVRDLARKVNACAFCGKYLTDRRRMYCNDEHREAFWKKWAYHVVEDWRDTRKAVLMRDHGLCQPCRRAGRITRAREVHHIIEIADGGPEFKEDYCESTCKPCHKSLTAEGRRKRTCFKKNVGKVLSAIRLAIQLCH